MRGKRFAAVKLWALPACMLGAGLVAAQGASAYAQGAPTPTQAKNLPSTVFVLESARSMRDKLDGTAKLDITRTHLEEALANQAGRVAFGLVAFGHRKSKSCSDTEVLATPGTLNGETAEEHLGGLKPRGRAPIATAISDAATLAQAGKPLDLILIADGKDSCKKSVCAIAKSLKQASASLRVHVVGLNGKAEALEPLACIAEATGGKFVAATSGTAFRDGLDAVLASIANPPVPLNAMGMAAAPGRAAEGAAQGQAALKKLPGETAVFKSGSSIAFKSCTKQRPVPVSLEALRSPRAVAQTAGSGLVWRVYKAKPASDGSFELISTHREPMHRPHHSCPGNIWSMRPMGFPT